MRNQRSRSSKIKRIFLEHIQNNLREYFIVMIVFLIGLVLGTIFINNSNQMQKDEISNYINSFVQNIKTDYSIDNGKLLMNSIKNNLYLVVLLWLAGSTVVGMPVVYGIIGFRGFCLSYTIASIMATLGTRKRTFIYINIYAIANNIYYSSNFCTRSKWNKII